MLRIPVCFISLMLILLTEGCTNRQNINFQSYPDRAELRFRERSQQFDTLFPDLDLVRKSDLKPEVIDAIIFLYAYMPLGDIADYSPAFYKDNAELAVKSRHESVWRENISDEMFYHFVLPVRVNNENLDSFRIKYFKEIGDRISGIDNIESAALEINHWCHEKVTYQPADIRTSSPLSTILSARGRCGEESTFTVAAMRAAGIPARQVYTPRWAHSDDNHAWVEIWNGEEWRYLGACEPEPLLDRGWFTEPARRAMLVNTKAFGEYLGSEKTTYKRNNFAEINVLGKYAVTKDITVRALNSDGSLAHNAVVEFKLYNYAEFYPLAKLAVDKDAYATFCTGLGDLLIWVSEGERYSFKKISVADFDTLEITIPDIEGASGTYKYDLSAPAVLNPFPGIPRELAMANTRRLVYEDSLRSVYENSWISNNETAEVASKYGYPKDILQELVAKSMGNYREVLAFLEKTSSDNIDLAFRLLSAVSDKDLRDTRAEIFLDHLKGTEHFSSSSYDSKFFDEYILNPRIENELLSDWRLYLNTYFDKQKIEFVSKPQLIWDWITGNIKIAESENYYKVPISPRGVLAIRHSDKLSADILFVASCRSLGIPSRFDQVSDRAQFFKNGLWHFSDGSVPGDKSEYATVSLKYDKGQMTPQYFTHFTIARLQNGTFHTVKFPDNGGADTFSKGVLLEPGRYMLVTGNRIDDKTVLSQLDIFDLEPGEIKKLDVNLRSVEYRTPEIGKIDIKTLDEIRTSSGVGLSGKENKLVMAWIEHEREPTKHLLNNLPELKSEFDSRDFSFIFLSDPATISDSFLPEELNGLPDKSSFIFDADFSMLGKIVGERGIDAISFPFIVCVNSAGEIVFESEGYNIGVGEKILKAFN